MGAEYKLDTDLRACRGGEVTYWFLWRGLCAISRDNYDSDPVYQVILLGDWIYVLYILGGAK